MKRFAGWAGWAAVTVVLLLLALNLFPGLYALKWGRGVLEVVFWGVSRINLSILAPVAAVLIPIVIGLFWGRRGGHE